MGKLDIFCGSGCRKDWKACVGRRRRSQGWVFVSVLAASFANAQGLASHIDAAMRYDATYRAARAQFDATRSKLDQARAGFLPTLSLSANTTRNDLDVSYENSSQAPLNRQFNTHGYTLQLTQPIFRRANFANYAQSGYLVTQAEAQFSQAEADLVLRVAQTYYDYLLAKESLEFLRAQKKAVAEQLFAAEKGWSIGAAAITDVQEAKAKQALVLAQELEAESDRAYKFRQLKTLVGPDLPEPTVSHDGAVTPVSGKLEDWLARVEDHPLVKVALAATHAAEEEVSKARAGYFPSLDLVATSADNTQGPSAALPTSTRNRSQSVGLQLQVPLFSGGETNAKVAEALKLKEKAEQELENARRQAELQIAQAYAGIQSGLLQIRAMEEGVMASETALKANTKGYLVGMRTNADVLSAQQQLYAAKRDLNKSRYAVLMQHLKLKAAVGEMR